MNTSTTLSPEQFQQIITLVYIVVIALSALVMTGFGAVVLVLRQYAGTLHLLYQSAAPDTQKLLRGIAVDAKEVADLAVEITAPDAPPAIPAAPLTTQTRLDVLAQSGIINKPNPPTADQSEGQM